MKLFLIVSINPRVFDEAPCVYSVWTDELNAYKEFEHLIKDLVYGKELNVEL